MPLMTSPLTSIRKDPYIYLAWLVVVGLAIFLRTHHLDQRPVHADEATGARILAQQLEGEAYTFNPKHFHGPMLTQLTRPIAHFRGESNWSQLSITTLRSSTALAGILLIFTPLLWVRLLGRWGAWGAAALLTTSPLLVYYSRMYIHESWLALFSMLACASIYQVAHAPTTKRALAAGLAIGLMFATKETFAISILSWIPAALLLLILQKTTAQPTTSSTSFSAYLRAAAILFVVSIACAGLLYSNCLRNPAQFLDAFRTFFEYETTLGHDKAPSYYLQLLLWPKHAVGVWWTEAFVAILAATALIAGLINRTGRRVCLFLTTATLLHGLIYSTIAYKTPWLMLVPWAHACLLAGYSFQIIQAQGKRVRYALAALALFGLAYQAHQSLLASGKLANSSRNPYVYVPTSADAPKLQHWLQQLDAIHPLGTIAVVGQEYWPLPWYLRHTATSIGYWPTPNETIKTFPVVVAMPAQQRATQALLQSTHSELPRSLRANVPILLYLRNDVWDLWQHSPQP